jgi:glycosyltransferase involved in cell wall biosynthesis
MNNVDIKISVLMGIYSENEIWLKDSINSILNQTFTQFEFIIINDNPERELNTSILNEFKLSDKRIIVINNEKNLGLTRSLNIGLKLAKGKYIARMDADDISLPNRFSKQFSFMEAHKEVVACGSFIKIFGKINRVDTSLPTSYESFRNVLLLKNPLPHPTAFIRNEILKKNSITYDENLKFSQDFGLWANLSMYGALSNIPKILLKYRVTDNQISISSKSGQISCAQSVRKGLLRKELKRMNIQADFNNLQILFKNIALTEQKTNRRSYLLLLLFLSYTKHSFNDIFLLLIKTNWNVLVDNFKLIILRVLFKNKYPSLL